MSDRRRQSNLISPQYEDKGIFKTELGQYAVQLVPLFARNQRDDVMIKGYIDGESAIDVVFAGRRAAMVEPLVNMLRLLWASATQSAASTQSLPKVDEVLFAVRVEGVWRPRFERDDQGWQTRQLQLYAARWAMVDRQGKPAFFGEYPLK